LAAAVAQPNRGEDGYDLIEWISQQSWCDGNIGTWGPSALGKVQFETAREQHPNHKCAVPLVAQPVFYYEDYFPGGVYRTEYVDQLDALGYGMSTTLLANPVKNLTWNFVEAQSIYPSQITIPFFMIGGWFDHNVDGMLDYFNLLKTQSPVAVRDKHKLLMGPWCHGGNGTAYVGSLQQGEWQYPTAEGLNDSLALEFFDYYLRGQIANDWTFFDNVQRLEFETGNEMYFTDHIAVSGTEFYLNDNGILAPSLINPGDTTIMYDPRDPSPTIGGPTLRQDLDQGPYDQSLSVETRNDIASFDLFYNDWAMYNFRIYGKPEVHLFVSSDRKDTDFTVRITEVNDATDESVILADGVRRLRFRDGYTASDTAVAIPGNIYELIIDIPFMSHDFTMSGINHLRLDITSSNYPRFDLNLNNGGTMYTAGDSLIANNTIYYNASYSSYIKIPFLNDVGMDEIQNKRLIHSYPNPANSLVNFTLPKNENWNISITDINGRIISQSVFTGENYSCNIENWVNGIYFVQFTDSENLMYHSRFIKH
jgi:predicted acyl esterase